MTLRHCDWVLDLNLLVIVQNSCVLITNPTSSICFEANLHQPSFFPPPSHSPNLQLTTLPQEHIDTGSLFNVIIIIEGDLLN